MQNDAININLPKLSREKWLFLASLYVSACLPLGFLFIALVAIMRQQGTPLEQLSIVYSAGIFWALKFLWAPLIDKWRFGFLGHYRGWLIITQLITISVLLVMSKLDLIEDFSAIIAISMLLGFLSATLDAVANALAFRLLPGGDRGFGNSIQAAGKLIGNLFGGGIILMLYPTVGWDGSVLLLVAGIVLSLILVLRFQEDNFQYQHPSVKDSIKRYVSFWKRNHGLYWFLFLAAYPLCISLAWPLVTPMLVDADWQLDDIGFVVNVVGSAIGILGAMLAGWLVKQFGRRITVVITLIIQVPTALLMILITQGHVTFLPVAFIVSALMFGYSTVAAVTYTLMMDHASEKHPATDIALQYSLFNLFSILASILATALAGYFGYSFVLITAAAIVLVAFTVSYKYPFKEFNHE